MSSIKEYWARMTPEERSAEMRRRQAKTKRKKPTRTLSAAGRKNIVQAQKKRWNKQRRMKHGNTNGSTPTFTQHDLIYEGTTAFTAGEVYATIKQRAEAAELPYAPFAERIVDFIRATTHRKQLGSANRMPLLPGQASS